MQRKENVEQQKKKKRDDLEPWGFHFFSFEEE
jgi:hypothetical protein